MLKLALHELFAKTTKTPSEKCTVCVNGITNSKTTFTLTTDSAISVIKNVPCYRCNSCKKCNFSEHTIKKLELITTQHFIKPKNKIPVYEYDFEDSKNG